MAYSIHGNETSGADAALGVIYHLIANKIKIVGMLENMVVIVDPMMTGNVKTDLQNLLSNTVNSHSMMINHYCMLVTGHQAEFNHYFLI